MKFIAGMYGKAPEKSKEDIKEKEREKRRLENKVSKEELKNVSEKLKNQFGKEEFPSNVSDLYNHPNFPYITTQLINEGFLTVSREVNGNLLYKVSENNFETMPESEEETKPETPEQKSEDKKIVTAINEATPENRPETEAKVFGEIKQDWAITFDEYKKSLIEYKNKRVIDELESRIKYYTKELEPERLKQISGDVENYKKLMLMRKERYEKTLKEYLNGELNDKLKPEFSWGYMLKEYNSMRDKESPEAKSLKRKLTSKENKAKAEHERLIRKAIKEGNVIPANVLKEYPEIQKDDASKMTIPDINYKPEVKEKTVFLGAVEGENTKRNIKVNDYTKVPPKDVYLVDEETILNVPRPSYIPEMDLEDFAGYKGSSQIFDIVRIEPNKYIIVDKRYPVRRVMDRREEYDPRSAYTVYEGKKVTDEERAEYNKRTIEKRNYFEMNAETLAATWDYYRKLYRAKQRQEFEEKQDREEAYYNKQKQKTLEAGKEWKYAPFKRKTIRPKTVSPDSNKMSFSQAFMIQDFTGIKAPVSEFTGPTRMNLDLFMNYQAMLRELDYKINDLRLQRQYDNENSTYKKGQETAYGDSGTKPDLLESKGVLVKRQNGSEIDDQDVGKIGMLLDDLYSVFGDRSSMSKKYGLKISYAGEKRMHASKAVGLFIDKYKCIAVSDFSIEGRGFTVAHEYAHFMDSYIGDQKGYHFSSDQEGSTSNAIASTFRDKLNLKLDPSSRKEAGADYYKRTCECFARAMEQYYAIKQGTENVLYDSYDAKKIGIYVEHTKFMKDIFPLCEKFLTENEELLKAFHKEFDNNKKVFIKKKNPLTGKFEYRKVR
ncbi:MAG: hypothetical protein BWY36_00929 [Candidatus Diapherotrites archaeon ADurb.Bin253]|nr:MAG: hypothetical protein BWY36_00929 [Candidatus Diapherotrites archaeon ADurb.Bin253]